MNPWRGLGGMPREVWIVFSVTLINRAGTMVLPFLALYVTRGQSLSETDAGVILVAYGVGALITSPLSGWLVDRVGARRMMIFSLLSSAVLLFALSAAQNYWAIFCGVFAWAVVSEAFRPASLTIMSELVAPELRKSAFALSRLAINVGMSIGPAVGGFLAAWSFKALFVVDSLTSLAAGIVLLAAPWSYHERAVSKGETEAEAVPAAGARVNGSASRDDGNAYYDRRLLYFLVSLIPVVVVYFQIRSTAPLYVVRYLSMPESAWGLLVIINTIMVIVLEVPLNGLTATWAHNRASALGAFLIGAGLGGLALARSFWGTAVTIVILTFGEMIFIPASSAYVAHIAPAKSKGQYLGLYTMAFNIAFLIAVVAGTQTLEKLGPTVLWLSAFAFGLLSAAMLLGLNDDRITAESEGKD